uniref:Uncharacterized protein n=1 Tax=Meloidogyne enterolobii TaxID=390850 RepID=A0A6V7V1M5_MELEN|nr:unnamed protein product [Meloidogyne enterolobii]
MLSVNKMFFFLIHQLGLNMTLYLVNKTKELKDNAIQMMLRQPNKQHA